MALGQISNKNKAKPKLVTCATCKHFHRDTTGPSFNQETHIYFMGVCDLHLDPDHTFTELTGKAEIFANKPRVCFNHSAGGR